jgi:hypothetical protein
VEVPNRPERVLQVVEQSKAENEVELADIRELWIFDVSGVEGSVGNSSYRFFYVFFATVNSSDCEPK